MSKDYAVRREDADYALTRREGSDTFLFRDKRTGHRFQFHAVVPHGYQNTIFLYYYPTGERGDAVKSDGYKSGFLDKDSLPDWFIEECKHLYDTGSVRPATDPRGER